MNAASTYRGSRFTGARPHRRAIPCSTATTRFGSLIPRKYSLFGSVGNSFRKRSNGVHLRVRPPCRPALSRENSLYFPVVTGNSRRRPQRAAGPRLRPPPTTFLPSPGSQGPANEIPISGAIRDSPLRRLRVSVVRNAAHGQFRRTLLCARFRRFASGRKPAAGGESAGTRERQRHDGFGSRASESSVYDPARITNDGNCRCREPDGKITCPPGVESSAPCCRATPSSRARRDDESACFPCLDLR